MHLVSDLVLVMLTSAISGDCNGAFALLSGVAAGQYVYRWWRRNAGPAAPDPGPPPDAARRRSGELRAAISRLPAEQQRVVQLRFIEGCNVNEISARTGLSGDEIKSMQYRALSALAGAMSDEAEASAAPSPPQ